VHSSTATKIGTVVPPCSAAATRRAACLKDLAADQPPPALPPLPRCAVAGLQGLAASLSLPPALQLDPGSLSEAQRSAAGIRAMPATLGEALAAYEADTGGLPRC
jgi:glutamine synthetase